MIHGHINTTKRGSSFLERHQHRTSWYQRSTGANGNIKALGTCLTVTAVSLPMASSPSPPELCESPCLCPLWPAGYRGKQMPRFKTSTARSSSRKECRPEGLDICEIIDFPIKPTWTCPEPRVASRSQRSENERRRST